MATYNKRTPKRNSDSLERSIAVGEITSENVNETIALIYEINNEDLRKDVEKREPIKLIINSCGGCAYSGFGLIDVIIQSKTPIYTICHGMAFSMALPIMVAGHKRYSSRSSTFMYHGVSLDPGYDFAISHKLELKEAERQQGLLDKFLISKTKLTLKTLDSVKERKENLYITPEMALKQGIIDEII
jgi:ATP-dependent Clp protease protease subunit